MKLLIRKYKIKANNEYVFYCFTDINYIYKEFSRLTKNKDIKITKNNQELVFKGTQALFKLKVVELEKPIFYKAELTPISEQLMRFGGVTISCKFSRSGEYTNVISIITSNNTPGLIWKIVIKLIVFIISLQSRAYEKSYIHAIEKSVQ